MNGRRMLALAVVVAMGLPLTIATADHTPDSQGCPIHVTDTSGADPNVVDPTNDWEGLILGNGAATIPAGDVYREGTDITAAWLHRDADGDLTAHVQVVNLSTLQPNAIFYVLWDHAGSDTTQARRWVSARLKGYDTAFTYGYMTTNPVTGGNLFRTEGSTTGRFVEGANGEVIVDIPRGGTTLSGGSNNDWGAPAAGSTLGNVQAEARILAGSPEQLPPNPTNFRHGFVYLADSTELNGFDYCDAYVNP